MDARRSDEAGGKGASALIQITAKGVALNILLWIIFGGIAGWVGSLLVTGSGLGLIGNIVVGIVGAFIGGFIADRVGIGAQSRGADRPTSVASFVWAVVGAVVLLLVLNLIF